MPRLETCFSGQKFMRRCKRTIHTHRVTESLEQKVDTKCLVRSEDCDRLKFNATIYTQNYYDYNWLIWRDRMERAKCRKRKQHKFTCLCVIRPKPIHDTLGALNWEVRCSSGSSPSALYTLVRKCAKNDRTNATCQKTKTFTNVASTNCRTNRENV